MERKIEGYRNDQDKSSKYDQDKNLKPASR